MPCQRYLQIHILKTHPNLSLPTSILGKVLIDIIIFLGCILLDWPILQCIGDNVEGQKQRSYNEQDEMNFSPQLIQSQKGRGLTFCETIQMSVILWFTIIQFFLGTIHRHCEAKWNHVNENISSDAQLFWMGTIKNTCKSFLFLLHDIAILKEAQKWYCQRSSHHKSQSFYGENPLFGMMLGNTINSV